MTATTFDGSLLVPADSRLRRLMAGPAEGWLTLGGVALMLVALGWSIDDARWVGGVDEATDWLPLAGLAGVAVGFAGPKLGWGRWTTHLLGISFAALIMPIVAGAIVLGDTVSGWGPAAIAARYREAADIVYRVWLDLGPLGKLRTAESGHYYIAFGALMWATGQFAAYAVFGHRRALDAVIVTGLALLTNMSLMGSPPLHLMVLFSLAALVLLTRSHAFDERVTWLRRRIGDPAAVTALYLRGGAVFITGSVLGALMLTATASSAPLQGLWRDLPNNLVDLAQWLQRYVPLGGNSINPGVVAFGEDAVVYGFWTSRDDVAFRARFASTETERFYWVVGTYADFEGTAWKRDTTGTIERPGRIDLLTGTADNAVDVAGRRDVRFEVTPEDPMAGGMVVSPWTIRWVDRATRVNVTGSDEYLTGVEIDGRDTYTVTALVPIFGDDPGGITENRLRVASREYRPEITKLYLDVPDDAMGPLSEALLDTILARSPDDNPYDVARTMEAYLRDGRNFRYDTDVQQETSASCQGLSTVECFATIKAGYCQYYASTMAILLREHGIPTRLVQGFLPGDRSGDGTEVVRASGAHAWVQVYFPGFGWVDFDPTGGQVAEIVPPPSGPPESPTPRPSFSGATVGPRESEDLPGSRSPSITPGGPTGPTGPRTGPYVAIAALLVIGVLALGWVAWKRGPRPMHPDRAWGSIGRWAGRLGLAPRASQTVYEYAGILGDAVPVVRPELRTVAHAKVEMSYGRRDLSQDRLRAVAEAHRRLRLGLLRLAFRRPPRLFRRRKR